MPTPFTGDYAPDLFDEAKRYYLFQAQEQANLTDAELRDMHQISNTFVRRFVNTELGSGSPNDGFKIQYNSSDPVNNFLITGGDGSLDNPGVFYIKGYYMFLKGNIAYKDQTSFGKALSDDGYTKTVLPTLTTPTGDLNSLNTIATDGSSFFTSGVTGVISHSGDFGRNWTPGTSVGTINSISMVGLNQGLAAGASTRVFSTSDGTNWTLESPAWGSGVELFGSSFYNFDNGWVVGGQGYIYQKKSGSWLVPPNTTDTSNDLKSVWSGDTTKGWAVGLHGTIEYTSNNGTFWASQIGPVADATFNNVIGRNTSILYVFGSNGVILKTSNGGTSWSQLTSGTTKDLFGSYFINDNTGIAVGADGLVLKTTTAGSSWTSSVIADGTDLRSIVFFNDNTGFTAGEFGAIFRTLNGGSTWEKYRTDHVYIDSYLAEVSADATSGSEYYDADLEDVLIGLPSANRLRLVSDVKVSEGWPTPSDYNPDGTHQHYTAELAKIIRVVDSSSISSSMITDTRNRVLTLSEITSKLQQGGIDASSIADGSITPAKLNPTGDYTFGSVIVSGDTTVMGNLEVLGALKVSDYTTSLIMNNLTVLGSSTLGDPTTPYDDTVSIHGRIIQRHDSSAITYDLQTEAGTLNAPVFNIVSQGTGTVFNVSKTTDSVNPLLNITSAGKGYEVVITRSALQGGLFNMREDGTNSSIILQKLGGNNAGSILDMTSNKTDPVVKITNVSALSSVSLRIDQTAGTLAQMNATGNANILRLASIGDGTDISIVHSGSSGRPLDMTSSGIGSVRILNNKDVAVQIVQRANEFTLLDLVKEGTGDGRVLELSNYGNGTTFQVNTDGTGISQHISHVGDSTNAALHIYIAGNEQGPGLYMDKANDDTGELLRLRNGGLSSTFSVLQDNTDSSAVMFSLTNLGSGADFSSTGWWINRATLYMGDITSNSWKVDASGNLFIKSIQVDYSAFDSSNPGIAGKFYRDSSNFIKISAG